MEYAILILLVIAICLLIAILVFLMTRKQNETDMTERLGRFELNINQEIQKFKDDLGRNLNQNFSTINDRLEERLNMMNDKVNMRLDANFEKTNKTFTSVLERLSKIDEAQKKIDSLSGDIVSLQSILTDKKSRGIFGEVNLNHILTNVFGEHNDKIFALQYTLPNGTIADSVLFAPEPLGTIVIDSKFPLENYRHMVDKKIQLIEREMYEKQFKVDVKKHIDAIANKYIIPGVTSDQAIMFLPAEAIFAELNAYHADIIDYAYKKRVWIASPTTLISTLTVIQMILKNMERDRYTSIIHQELNKLGLEFARYKARWDHLSKSIQAVNKDIESVNITTDKITKKFDAINSVKVEEFKTDNMENEKKLEE